MIVLQLSFERVIDCGAGHAPQCVHDKYNKLRVIYLDDAGLVNCYEAIPALGLYDDLSFSDYGRCSPDENVSVPSIKRIAHFGAYGFWSADNADGIRLDHKFVIYMMPTDVSKTLVDGSVSFSVGSEVSSLSATLLNVRGELLNRHRAIVTPGTKLEVYFSLGSSGEVSLGVFFIDRADVSYPEEKVSVSARNAIGKLLKEQTFDEDTVFDKGSLHDNIKAILELAEVEDYFVGDSGDDKLLAFDPDTTILEGIKYAISLLSNWKIAETADGVVGVASASDARFDTPGVYTFERDHTCWSYHIEYDDSDAASRVCVWSKGATDDDPEVRVFLNVAYNKWWVQPTHRTLYVQTVDCATPAQVNAIAETLAASLAASGRLETFTGLFTPQLTLGDEVRVIDENGSLETVGTVTDVTHSFGKSGFHTEFSVDSGGRKGRTRLKDLITTAADYPEAFTGVRSSTSTKVEMKNALAISVASNTSISGTFAVAGGTMVVAVVTHRSTIGETPSGWTHLLTTAGFVSSGVTQQCSVFYKFTTETSVSATFTQATSERMYVNFVSLVNAGAPYVSLAEQSSTSASFTVQKRVTDAVLWSAHRYHWATGDGAVWQVDGISELIQQAQSEQPRLLSFLDRSKGATYTVSETSGSNNEAEHFGIGIPAQS